MAIIRPFRGITYNFKRFDDLAPLVTPPYDVISAAEQNDFYDAHPCNVIRLELGRTGAGDTDSNNRYTRAAETLASWLEGGVLVRTRRPCIYITAHSYRTGTDQRTRWGIIARVKIEDEGSGVVLPHEQTFSAHKTDRFKLMESCRTQFSQVFSVYEDPDGAVQSTFSSCESVRPETSFSFRDGSRHRMWALTDPDTIRKIGESFGDKALYIADGHHRYETAGNFRDAMRARGASAGEGPHEYVMMYLSSMDDQGLTILPYHRLLAADFPFDSDSFADRVSEWFTVEARGAGAGPEPAALETAMAEAGKGAASFAVCTGDGGCLLLRLKPGAEEHMGSDLHPALRRLDVQVLSELIFRKALGLTPEDLGNDELFRFDSSIESCLAKVRTGQVKAAFLLNPTPIESVKEVARAGLVMPGKSTFFHPKVITGLVFNPLEDDERL